MKRQQKKKWMRARRHRRIRGRVSGTAERPRVAVFRSSKQIYAQVVDDIAQATLCSASSLDLVKSGGLGDDATGGNVNGARAVGAELARRAKEKGITKVAFDRGGFRFHGRVKALADAAREGGMEF